MQLQETNGLYKHGMAVSCESMKAYYDVELACQQSSLMKISLKYRRPQDIGLVRWDD